LAHAFSAFGHDSPFHLGACTGAMCLGRLARWTDWIHVDRRLDDSELVRQVVLRERMGAGLDRMRDQVEPKFPLQRLGSRNEAAELGAFLCSDRASYINGAVIIVDGRYGIRFA